MKIKTNIALDTVPGIQQNVSQLHHHYHPKLCVEYGEYKNRGFLEPTN